MRVKLRTPGEAQLAVSRVEFKVKGDGKRRLRFKLTDADELPDRLVVVAQGAKERRNRLVAIIAIGNTRTSDNVEAAGAHASGVPNIINVIARSPGNEIKAIPADSRGFVDVLGTEPANPRSKAQRIFEIDQDQFRLNGDGGFVLKFPDLKLKGDPNTLHGAEALGLGNVPPLQFVASSVAGALGPPATLHADVVNVVSGEPVPGVLSSSASPSPSDPNVVVFDVTYSTPIFGGQVSPFESDAIVFNSNARCATGDGRFGTVIDVPGPFGGTSLLCNHFDPPQQRLFFDIPTSFPARSGDQIGDFMPYMGDDVNAPVDGQYPEGVWGEGVSPDIIVD